MKLSLLSLCALFLLNWSDSTLAEERPQPEVEIAEGHIVLPKGRSQWRLNLRGPAQYDHIRVHFEALNSCPTSPTSEVMVAYSGDKRWSYTQGQSGGVFKVQQRPIEAVRFIFTQRYKDKADCHLHVYGGYSDNQPGDPRPPLPGDDRTLVGVLDYPGGFINRQAFTFDREIYGSLLQMVVPSYCRDVDILEMGIRPYGKFIPAKMTNKEQGMFRLGKNYELDEIEISMNGPQGLNCEIPVYVYDSQALSFVRE